MDTKTALRLPALRSDLPVARYATKSAAAAALKHFGGLSPEVRPERAESRFFRFWVLAVEPIGDPGEGRALLTEGGNWVIVCAVGCVDPVYPGAGCTCPGHPMSIEEGAEFTRVLIGHRTEIIHIGTDRKVQRTDGSHDWYPGGSLYRARCLGCDWKSGRLDERRFASRAARKHELLPV